MEPNIYLAMNENQNFHQMQKSSNQFQRWLHIERNPITFVRIVRHGKNSHGKDEFSIILIEKEKL